MSNYREIYLFDQLQLGRPWHELGKAGLSWCENLVPHGNSLAPIYQFNASKAVDGGAENQHPVKVFGHTMPGNADYLFIGWVKDGFTDDIHVQAHEFGNLSASGSQYIATASEMVEIANYGNKVIVQSQGEAVQVWGGSSFSSLITSTSKPEGRFVDTVGSHLILAFVEDPADDDDSIKYWWSATGDADDFDVGSGNSGFAYLRADLGPITGFFGFQDYGIFLQERGVTRIQRHPTTYWEAFAIGEGEVGCTVPGCSTKIGTDIYYLNRNGLWRVVAGQKVEKVVAMKDLARVFPWFNQGEALYYEPDVTLGYYERPLMFRASSSHVGVSSYKPASPSEITKRSIFMYDTESGRYTTMAPVFYALGGAPAGFKGTVIYADAGAKGFQRSLRNGNVVPLSGSVAIYNPHDSNGSEARIYGCYLDGSSGGTRTFEPWEAHTFAWKPDTPSAITSIRLLWSWLDVDGDHAAPQIDASIRILGADAPFELLGGSPPVDITVSEADIGADGMIPVCPKASARYYRFIVSCAEWTDPAGFLGDVHTPIDVTGLEINMEATGSTRVL